MLYFVPESKNLISFIDRNGHFLLWHQPPCWTTGSRRYHSGKHEIRQIHGVSNTLYKLSGR